MTIRRVLFIGPLWPGYSCDARLRGLEREGLHVDAVDSFEWAGHSNTPIWLQRIATRFWLTPSVVKMNRDVERVARAAKPDLVWIEKGNWVYPLTLKVLRRSSQFLVHYNTDDVFNRRQHFWLMRQGLRLFDLHLTTNRFNVSEISQRSGARALRVGMGFDGEGHRPPTPPPPRFEGVVFVGHWEPHTEAYLVALRRAGIPIRVWGAGWRSATDAALRSAVLLPKDAYNATIAGARIALGALSRANRNETTGRSFEIPALGTCLLAERTPEHDYLYRDGREALFFTTTTELVDKATRYLAKPEEAAAIAASGRARCLELALSWEGHVAREWPLVERLVHGGSLATDGSDDAPFWPGYRRGAPIATV